MPWQATTVCPRWLCCIAFSSSALRCIDCTHNIPTDRRDLEIVLFKSSLSHRQKEPVYGRGADGNFKIELDAVDLQPLQPHLADSRPKVSEHCVVRDATSEVSEWDS